MRGRKPIFAGLIVSLYSFLRDGLYKALLEPASATERRAKKIHKIKKNKKSKKKS